MPRARRALCALPLALALAGCTDDDPAAPEDAAPLADAAPDAAALDQALPDLGPPDQDPPDLALPDAAIPDMAPPDMGPTDPYEALTACLTRLVAESDATGAAVAIIEGGAVTFQAGVGTRGPEDERPVGPATLFRFGSVLKGMTALGVLGYVDQGAITLDTPIVDIVPALGDHPDPRWHDLTVHHVISHQGGFADYIGLEAPGAPDSRLAEYLTGEEFGARAYFMADPGSFYNYANPNFMIAGLVLETLAGEPYRLAMQHRVFEPLGLARMPFLADDVIADGDFAVGVTAGFVPGTTRPAPPDAYDAVWVRPAGLGWASVEDLARYAQYIIARPDDGPAAALISADTWTAWRTPYADAESFAVATGYGYGLFIYDGVMLGPESYHPVEIIEHGGNINGYTAQLVTAPALGFGAALLVNGDALNDRLNACAAPLLAAQPGLPPAEAPPADRAVDRATFVDYVGDFDDPNNVGPIHVALDETGDLTLSMPLVEEAEVPYEPVLIDVARDMFLLRIQGLVIPISGIRRAGEETVHWLRTRFFVGTRPEQLEPVQKRAPTADALRRRLDALRTLPPPPPLRFTPE
ncbi:MAG: serine hydrolase domain-containing protein [bacterium]